MCPLLIPLLIFGRRGEASPLLRAEWNMVTHRIILRGESGRVVTTYIGVGFRLRGRMPGVSAAWNRGCCKIQIVRALSPQAVLQRAS